MAKFAIKRSIWIRLVVALAVLVIPASVYFFTYFNTKYDFAIQQRFRALNGLEQQFTRGLANFDNIFRFSGAQTLTLDEWKEATAVVSSFKTHMDAWEEWEADKEARQTKTEDISRYRLLHRERKALQERIFDVTEQIEKLSESKSAADEVIDRLKAAPEERSLLKANKKAQSPKTRQMQENISELSVYQENVNQEIAALAGTLVELGNRFRKCRCSGSPFGARVSPVDRGSSESCRRAKCSACGALYPSEAPAKAPNKIRFLGIQSLRNRSAFGGFGAL